MQRLPDTLLMAALSLQDRDFLETVFRLQCTSRMSAYYYEARLAHLQRHSFTIELTIALTASGSAVAGLAFWQTAIWGQWIWLAITSVSAVAAVIKPLYAPARKITLFTRQHQSYHNNYFALEKLMLGIKQADHITADHRKRFETIFDRHVQLSGEDEPVPVSKAQRLAEARCAQALRPEDFWAFWASLASKEAKREAAPAGAENSIKLEAVQARNARG